MTVYFYLPCSKGTNNSLQRTFAPQCTELLLGQNDAAKVETALGTGGTVFFDLKELVINGQ